MIPLCHPIPIESANIEFSLEKNRIRIIAKVKAKARTGLEMEALTATSVAALTIYDMCKPIDKNIVISEIKLLKKNRRKERNVCKKVKSKKAK